MKPVLLYPVLTVLGLVAALALRAAEPVSFPADYRHWTHVKSMLIEPGHALADPFEGLHHIYANELALTGYETGAFPDGAIIVFDLLEADAADGAVTEGDRKFVGVMQRNAAAHAATGGWAYEVFVGDSRTERGVTDGGAGCHGCHSARKAQGYVFSSWRP